MRVPFAAVALAAAAGLVLSVSPVAAQLRRPANPPPADFTGLQFVDQSGCLFLRAGFGARTVWVPMVDDQHKPICGMAPTLTGGAAANAMASPAAPRPAPKPQTAMATPAARPASSAAGARTAASPAPPVVPGYQNVAISTTTAPAPALVAPTAIPAPPRGWKLAWTDGRLNPLRGIGTPEGQAMQDLIWTRTVPARPVVPAAVAEWALPAKPITRVSTMSAPASVQLYVQIGAFSVPANAGAARASVVAMGLPAVSTPPGEGRTLQIVYAGPFAARPDAKAALSQLAAAGYRDAFIR